MEPSREDLRPLGQGLSALARSGELVGDRVGLFLELYGIPVGEAYRLRARAVGPEGGPGTPVSFRPAGQELFGAEWTRRPLDPRISPEYLTLDLSGVEPGAYDLQVEVVREDGTVHRRILPGLTRIRTARPPEPLSLPPEIL